MTNPLLAGPARAVLCVLLLLCSSGCEQGDRGAAPLSWSVPGLALAHAAAPPERLPSRPQAGRAGPAADRPRLKATPLRADLPSVVLQAVPHVKQRPDFCGEACAEMALRHLGHDITQDEVFTATGLNPSLGRGARAAELVFGLRRLGLDPGEVWHAIPAREPGPVIKAQLAALHADLLAGIPSIICTRYDESPGTTQHFRLVVGFDNGTDEVIYHEPAEEKGAYRRMKLARLLRLWPLRYRPGRKILVRMPLRPVGIRVPPRANRPRHSPADYAQHVMALREKTRTLRGHFTVVVEPPFVVVGNGWRGDVHRHASGLIRWATARLKAEYFPKDPQQILDIWLFASRETYLANTYRLFGEYPTTPFGFYSDAHHALVMNIRTGGGTLVHELVHPFVEANFPGCPPWFNEGLGSLYEAVGRREGKIWGYPNWRLPGLQQAIRAGGTLPLQELMAQNEKRFYLQDPGTNYSQSRYLLYYLQHKGLLHTFYHQFLAGRGLDPTGYETFKKVLGIQDVAAFERRWRAFVLSLRYP